MLISSCVFLFLVYKEGALHDSQFKFFVLHLTLTLLVQEKSNSVYVNDYKEGHNMPPLRANLGSFFFAVQVIMFLNLTGSFTSSVMSLTLVTSEEPAHPSSSGQPRPPKSC